MTKISIRETIHRMYSLRKWREGLQDKLELPASLVRAR